MKKKIVLIAAGGTGGHIYPGIAIAEALNKKGFEVQFVGTRQGLESKIIPQKGYQLHFISIGKLHKSVSLSDRLKTLLLLPLSFIKVFFILLKTRPVAVIGTGGFVSGPTVFMAWVMRVRTAIWEPNAIPGLTNRLLGRFVDLAFVVFDDAKIFLMSKKVVHSGMPVRSEICIKQKVRDDSDFHVLIFGGSQGARAINHLVIDAVTSEKQWLEGVQIILQTGALDFEKVFEALKDEKKVKVLEYLHDMINYYSWADLVVCRAGASTLAELAACKKASILIPFPYASDGHQKENALALVKDSAALMIEQSELNVAVFKQLIHKLKFNPSQRESIESNIVKFYQPRAAEEIAEKLVIHVI